MKEVSLLDYAGIIINTLPKGLLVTTKTDKVNSMVISWGMLGIEWNKPLFITFVREGRFTRSQLDRHPAFTVNIPLTGKLPTNIFKVCGSLSGRELDKVQAAGLTLVDCPQVDVPGILEAPLTLACRVVYRQEQPLHLIAPQFQASYPQDVPSTHPMGNKDPHIAYYGEIVGAYLAE